MRRSAQPRGELDLDVFLVIKVGQMVSYIGHRSGPLQVTAPAYFQLISNCPPESMVHQKQGPSWHIRPTNDGPPRGDPARQRIIVHI